ncbi:MAG: acyltransferase [Terriglobus sp.]
MQNIQADVPQEIRAHRYPELDALRGLAASTVVLFHLAMFGNSSSGYAPLMSSPLRIFVSGPQAVILFFLLSGFVLSAAQTSPRNPGYALYLAKRMCRLYLPFFAALIVAYAFASHFYLRTPTFNEWANSTWGQKPVFKELVLAALTRMPYAMEFNTAFWSVFLEIRISLVFPLLFLLVKRIPAWGSGLLLLTLLLITPFAKHHVEPLQALTLFLFGILAFLHLQTLRRWMALPSTRMRTILLVASLLAYTFSLNPAHLSRAHANGSIAADSVIAPQTVNGFGIHSVVQGELQQVRFITCAVASLTLMLGAMMQPGMRQFLQHPFLLRLGALSYSMYLMHGTVLFSMMRGLWGKISAGIFIPLYFLLVYATSELFHLLVDAPAIQLGRRVGRSVRKHAG